MHMPVAAVSVATSQWPEAHILRHKAAFGVEAFAVAAVLAPMDV